MNCDGSVLLTGAPRGDLDINGDPDAEPPQIIGMYERGPTELPVLWG